MYDQTTQVHIERNLVAYFLLNKIPPSSSQVGLAIFGTRSSFVLEKAHMYFKFLV